MPGSAASIDAKSKVLTFLDEDAMVCLGPGIDVLSCGVTR